MTIYDISLPIYNGMPVYPGDPQVTIERIHDMEKGDPDNLSRMQFSTHTGTHVDAPLHFIRDGVPVDRLPLETLIGPASVVDVTGKPEITREVLASLPLRHPARLLLKTGNSGLTDDGFDTGYTSVTEDAARYLVEKGVALLGIEALSVERVDGTGNVHRLLLEKGVVILEGVDLSAVPAGEYELICMPLRIAGGDGAPARALLRSMSRPGDGSGFDPHSSRWPLS